MAMNNSLTEVHPELVSEWSEKNLPLTPNDITFGSNKKVWWKGACGHEWQASVKARSNGEKCPICSGARVIAGINDLATLEPLLVKQWSKKNKIITSMKEVPEQLGKLRRQYLRYQQAEIIYSISHKKLFELASDAGAIYRIDGTVLINRDIFDDYLERFHEPATRKGKEEMADER